ncbi:glycosyltransferase family 4 protein [Nostoc sp. PCC 7107]|uniref:glycosyltransferase family 4 protein n=1 Tax=Nostoc sp. PCC 7107 TaxID=317936 RepID=UPI00029F452C|nr:glycosyltransferase family 4 protein [Nostoc sp. PCC 7107]AFY40740.1 glycosyl transferase group 1 [Nostoc sp. PCC 7107]
MKIAYVTVNDIYNQNSWSKDVQGVCAAGYHISKHLIDESVEIDYLGPLSKNFTAFTKLKWTFYHYISKKDYYRWAEPLIAKDYAHQVQRKLKNLNSHIVLCPENIVPIAYLDCKQPIVIWTDATLSSLINFYRHMDNLCQENIRNIHLMEAEALNRCKLIIYTSDWAAKQAMKTYNIAANKIKVVPYGANLVCNRTLEDIHNIIKSKPQRPCKLLFMGVDWIRKGGNLAFEITKQLNDMGLNTELTIVGCKPKINEPLPQFVKYIEFIDKSKKTGLEKINQLFAEAHFLILPTIADCTPHVVAEANSFGVPAISTNVGGLATLIHDDLNGKIFPLDGSISAYCNYIITMMSNHDDYDQLAFSSFNEYQNRLNWNVAVQKTKKLINNFIV